MSDSINIVRGSWTPGGFDINGDGKADVTFRQLDAMRQHRGSEVRQLNQYTGYFTTPEGDFPVSCVANSIKDAARILSMPGVFGPDVNEPTMIKFIKGSIAVAAPVHTVGFNTVITPAGAVDSGAYATPNHADVQNGSDVIFTAYEPFGWKFDGWYKGDPDNGGTLLSTEKVTTIDVYDAYSTLISYYAKYTFEPKLRNGRYLDVLRGVVYDIKFDGYSSFYGKVDVKASDVSSYHFVMESLDVQEDGTGSMKLIKDETIVQPEDIEAVIDFVPSYIGINLVVKNITVGNILGLTNNSVVNLKWVGEND